MTNIPPKLEEYLNKSRLPLPPLSSLDEPLQLDSLGLIRLVAFLESDLDIRVEDDELLAENFTNLRAIGDLLEGKGRAAQKDEGPPS